VWVRLTSAGEDIPGTVNVELGGLARTDNSGWGDEFERLAERLSAGLGDSAVEPANTVANATTAAQAGRDAR
jgi:cytochrome c biogenesis protein